MTHEEFENYADAVGPVTDDQFKMIEFVYNFHPSISETRGKQQITDLYKVGGMRIIVDMLPTATKAKDLEERIRNTRITLDALVDEMAALRRGDA